MRITMAKLLALLTAGCFLLGVTLANETNKAQPGQKHNLEQQLLRHKRGLLSALFGTGAGDEQTTALPTEVLPVYGDPAQPPLHMLYGHSTGLQGPYPPYPVMFVPGAPAPGGHGPYLPMLAYGGVAPGSFQPAAAGDNNHLPAVIGWQEPSAFPTLVPAPSAPVSAVQPSSPRTPVSASQSKPSTPSQGDQGQAKSAYLLKLNLSPAEERELKRLAKLLGVTDFEHLPPFEDVKALLGTTTSEETIRAIKEYASTPDGLELIKDYVMSYQPAKRISLGKEPYAGDGAEPEASDVAATTDAPASTLGSGFLAQLRRLKSLLTFGYFDASDDARPAEAPLENEIVVPEVPREAPFTPNEFPGFEVRDVRGSPVPVAHYLIPVRTLPRRSSAAELKYASALPFPYAVHYPPVVPQLQDSNPFVLRTESEVLPFVSDVPHRVVGADSTLRGSSDAPHPTRVAPPTLATGEVHSFERTDIEQPVRTTTPAEQHQEVLASSSVVEPNVAPTLAADVAELADDTTDFILNVLDTVHTT